MDPVSIAGLAVLTGQIANSIYNYGAGVRNARKEIDQLCVDLFALKGTLEHVRLHIESCKFIDEDADASSTFSMSSQVFRTDEFNDMIASTDELLQNLARLVEKSPNRRGKIVHYLMWPLTRSEVQEYTSRLEKMKSYFILAITSDNLEVSKQVYSEVHALGQIVRAQREEYQEKAEDERRQTLLQWVAPYDSKELHQKALQARQAGTGQWFLTKPFRQWIEAGNSQVLWLRGRPGVGKTSLISAAIEELNSQAYLDSEKNFMAFFHCSFTDQLSQDPKNIFGSLIAQLCNAQPSLWSKIDQWHTIRKSKGHGSLRSLETAVLQQVLREICWSFPKIFLFIDAPNESSESALIVSTMWDLVREHHGMRIMISSTEEVVMAPLASDEELLSTVVMSSAETQQDISDYVDAKLKQDDRLRHLSSRLKDDIKSSLVNKSDGVFRWVQCQLEALGDRKTPKAIRNALQDIPQSLEKTYCDILLRIPESDRELAKEVLLWLTFAMRTLKLNELCEAVVMEENSTTIDDEDCLLHPMDLLRMCRSLISFNPATNHVTLAHSSVQAYLTNPEIKDSPARYFFLDPSAAQSLLIRRCLTYLCFDEFKRGYSDHPEDIAKLSSRWPLLDYAVALWPAHARALGTTGQEPDQPLRDILLKFFATYREPRNGNFGAWIQQYLPEAGIRITKSPPFYYAARFGLLSVVKMILAVEGTKDLETVGGRRDSTPLHVASAYGHTEVVKVLLAAGASPLAVNSKGRTGLLTAAENGETEIIKMLLASGADPNHRTGSGKTALYLSIVNFEKDCVRALKEAGADTSNVDGAGTSAEDLQEIVAKMMPDGTPGQVRYARELDPRSGTNPRAKGAELPTAHDKRLRKEIADRLRKFSIAKLSEESLPHLELASTAEGNPDMSAHITEQHRQDPA
jgi:hypothetical protein